MTVIEHRYSARRLIPVVRRRGLEFYEFGSEDGVAHPVLFHYGLPGSGYLASLAHEVAKQLNLRLIAPNPPRGRPLDLRPQREALRR